MRLHARDLTRDALGDLRRTWPQLVVSDVLARVLAVVVATPLVGLLLALFLAGTGGVLTDQGIVAFLVHPTGLVALLTVGSVVVGVLFAETGQLMVIAFGAVEDRRVSWLEALQYVVRRAAALGRLAWAAVVKLLALAAPFLAVGGSVVWLLLRGHDINYYLAERPPAFWAAAGVAGVLLAALASLVLLRISGWILSVPMVLFEGKGGKAALGASEEATAAGRRQIALGLVSLILTWLVVSSLAAWLVGVIGDAIVPRDSANVGLVLAALCAVLLLSGLANLAVTVVATMSFPVLVVRLYRRLAGPGRLAPEIAARGSLGARPTGALTGKAILGGSLVVLVAMAAGVYLALGAMDGERPVEIIGHRGGAAVAPENTLAAFERAIADGADWLELDVQENADGAVVVAHDRDFMRSAGAALEVWRATSADLAGLDVGSSFGPGFAGERVPTLEAVLDLAKGRAGVFVELKYYGRNVGLEEKVVEIVEAAGMSPEVVVMSLEYDGVRRAKALRPTWTYGLLTAVSVGDLTRLDVEFLALASRAATRATIRRAHRRGLKLYAWTINDPVQMSVMMSRGVDGIITDQVALARQVLTAREALTPLGRLALWLAAESGLLHGMEESSARDEA